MLEKEEEGAAAGGGAGGARENDDAFICISDSLIIPLTVTMPRLM
jgi:hypothetical protein